MNRSVTHPTWQAMTPSAYRKHVRRAGGSDHAARSHSDTKDVLMTT
jgi:hypothetical protein